MKYVKGKRFREVFQDDASESENHQNPHFAAAVEDRRKKALATASKYHPCGMG